MSHDFIALVVNMDCEVSHEHAVKLVKIQLQVVKESGVRCDLVGIEAMCVLSGLRDEPAIMPVVQAIKYVNIVTGQVSGSKRNRNGGTNRVTRPRFN